MSHTHHIHDDDKRFSINSLTRVVTIPESDKIVLIQHDHNSEHITFECDRFVEDHDLSLCDIVEVHYNNIGSDSRRTNRGVYPVEDLKIHDSDDSKIQFTWIVSQNATMYKGILAFAVAFTCTNDGDIYYRWNTHINDDLVVSEGINNAESVENTYADVLEAWRLELFGIGDTEEARMLLVSQQQQDAIVKQGNETIASIPMEYYDLYSNVDDINTLLDFAIQTPNLYKSCEFDENGYYNYTDGLYVNDMPTYGSSGFIKVKENTRYIRQTSGYTTFWDTDKTFISGEPGLNNFVTPAGCVYVNCALLKELKHTFFLMEFGDVNYKILQSLIDPLNDYFTVETNNLYDQKFVADGCYDLNGNFANIDGYGSFTIPVTEGESYIKNWGGYVAYFDSTNNWISTTSIGSNTNFVVPSGAVKMNIAVLVTGAEYWLVRTGETYYRKLVSDYLPDSLNGLRYGALGDSITQGYGVTPYGDVLASSEKLMFTNYGISGNRIADSTETGSEPMYIRYTAMNDDLDIITVFGGTNDYASQTPIGENDDSTGSTFKGALNILCSGLISKYVGKRLGFITPIHRSSENASIPLVNYVNAVKEICGRYGIPVLDLYNTSTINCVNDDNSHGLLMDGLHPSDAGHEVLARKIASFIKTL